MMKMHLPVRPANEGARKLAQWIMRHCDGDLALARLKTRIDADTLQRMVAGEIVPGESLVRDVAVRVCRRIHRRHWRSPADGGWFESNGEPGSLGMKVAA